MAESNNSSSEHNFSNHLFREIYKNAWLNKVNSNNSEKSVVPNQTVFWIIQKPEKFWFVFCIHDDTEAYLEAYTDAKTSVMHRPTWIVCLNDTLHVSSTICSEFKEYEFVITLNSNVVRLLAPTREAMNDWVDTLRTKLTEMKILAPCKNMYTALPQAKTTLLPTRDPTSPLPPPPSSLMSAVPPPGTECVLPVTSTVNTTAHSTNGVESTTNSNSQAESFVVASSNCDNRGNSPSLINSQRQVLRRNLSMPNASESYITVIQVSDNDEMSSSPPRVPPHSAQHQLVTTTTPPPTSQIVSSAPIVPQIFDFNIPSLAVMETATSSNELQHPIQHSSSDTTPDDNNDSSDECNQDETEFTPPPPPPANQSTIATDQCSHYDCVFVPDITEARLQLQNVRPKNRSENSSIQSSLNSIEGTTSTSASQNQSHNLLEERSHPHSRRKELPLPQLTAQSPSFVSTENERTTTSVVRGVVNNATPADSNRAASTALSNLTREMTQLTLREQQVLRLQKEIKHPTGVRIQLSRKDCNNAIALVDVFGAVWIAGWKQKDNPMLYNLLHIGDQIVNVEGVFVQTAADVHKHLRRACKCNHFVTVIIKRVPFGKIFVIQREIEGEPLGIVQEQNTAVIKHVMANSLAARHGLSQRATTCDQLSFTNWVLTEINGRPLNLFYKNNEIRDRLNAIGREISILVQPLDLIKQIKKQLKSIRNYKDYIVQ